MFLKELRDNRVDLKIVKYFRRKTDDMHRRIITLGSVVDDM